MGDDDTGTVDAPGVVDLAAVGDRIAAGSARSARVLRELVVARVPELTPGYELRRRAEPIVEAMAQRGFRVDVDEVVARFEAEYRVSARRGDPTAPAGCDAGPATRSQAWMSSARSSTTSRGRP